MTKGQASGIVGSSAKEASGFAAARHVDGWAVAVLIAIFFLTLLPLVVDGSRYFGDEHFYTDGAMRMIQKGDYFTPYYVTDDGLPHFNKPILTYWAVAASYRILGISYFSSRLPFLIAGCLLLWVTFKTSLMLFHREDEAFIAAVVILSNFHLYSSSVRSTPDVFQCLFLSVSLYGFMDILFNGNKTALNYTFAYIGAALAVQTKGIPGVFPIVYAFLFCRLQSRRGVRPSDLIDVKSMAAGALVALFWFVVVYHKYGDAALKGFYEDQVRSNLGDGRIPFLGDCWSYLRVTATQFLPWSGLVLVALCLDSKTVRRFFQEHKNVCVFVGGWYLVLLFTFSLASFTRGRYMFPAYPLLAAVVSSLLARIMREGRAARVIRMAFGPLLLLGAVYGAILILVGAHINSRILFGGILAFCVSLGLYAILRRERYQYGLAALGLMLFLMFAVHDIFVRPVFDVSPTPRMTERLLQLDLQGKSVAGVGLERFTLSNIKVLSGGRIDGRNLPVHAAPEELEQHPILLLSKSVKERWNAPGYNVEKCGSTLAPFTISDVWAMIRRHDKDAVFAAKRVPYFLATKAPSKISLGLDRYSVPSLVVCSSSGPSNATNALGSRSAATGPLYEISYGNNGWRLILSVNDKLPRIGEVNDVMHSVEMGPPTNYEIHDGRIMTAIETTTFQMTARKLGDKYVLAQQRVRLHQLRTRVRKPVIGFGTASDEYVG